MSHLAFLYQVPICHQAVNAMDSEDNPDESLMTRYFDRLPAELEAHTVVSRATMEVIGVVNLFEAYGLYPESSKLRSALTTLFAAVDTFHEQDSNAKWVSILPPTWLSSPKLSHTPPPP